MYLREKSDSSGRYTLTLSLNFSLSHQANSVHHVQQEQCMTTTWPAAVVPAIRWARLTTPARPPSTKWTAVAVLREPIWTRRGSVCLVQAVPAMIKTLLFLVDRLSAKTAPHGKCRYVNRWALKSHKQHYTLNLDYVRDIFVPFYVSTEHTFYTMNSETWLK